MRAFLSSLIIMKMETKVVDRRQKIWSFFIPVSFADSIGMDEYACAGLFFGLMVILRISNKKKK